jgi:hypothetical protein
MHAVTISIAPPVMGKAKGINQLPPVARQIYNKYTPAAAKSQGINITGLGFLNHTGRINTYPTKRAPIT